MKMYNLDRIDFIKIDIEGGEYDLLNNTPVEVLDKIDKISCEMHGIFFPNEPNKDQDFYLPNKVRSSWTWFFNNSSDSETFFYFKNFNQVERKIVRIFVKRLEWATIKIQFSTFLQNNLENFKTFSKFLI